MKTTVRRAGVVTAAILCASVVGCGSPAAPSGSSAPSETPSAGTAPPAASSTAPPSTAADATVVDIGIADGVVTPTNGEAKGQVGMPIVLRVSSDVPDSLHVHSVPEHTFQVEPRPDQRFEFTVDVPGQVDIELHDLNRTVVTIQVRP
ncbi:hypothetical protein D8S82_05685 [Mycobacterium hodleri]|uniref:Lipoprotein n=1 Tax=Mycolicibacterium hodleri TaxID=49897 RepID=A0A544W634_9MYCO|nr:hypothetical protein [Mycolicibacterium hodleri]TQR87681.1 hypothetical protein D8S82_05685 [Mycolicibacterium hodleri]